MQTILLDGRGALAEWRDAARGLLLSGIRPDRVEWRVRSGDAGLFDAAVPMPSAPPSPAPGQGTLSVPRAFMELAETVLCHRDVRRFALLYRVLWRLQTDRSLLATAVDEDMAVLRLMEKSVRRDSHKMKAFLRFKEVDADRDGRRRFVAWFEPDHFIVARTAPFFQRRFTDMDWLILTPKGTAAWDGRTLEVTDSAAKRPDLDDQTDELWRTYFRHIFNPARLKVKAMQAEMPKKYWKNMPEAALIPELIASAEARIGAMIEAEQKAPPVRHERRRPLGGPAPEAPRSPLESLAREVAACSLCPLHAHATQTVFGEGAPDASLVIIGEQPGDTEDLAGRPFVGPAGKVLDAALGKAGIARETVWLTNAVKHFKYEPRGKKRIHQRPNSGEIAHCRFWLQREIEAIRPRVILAMGATAVEALTERADAFPALKGRQVPLGAEAVLVVTVHPSYLLRLPDPEARAREQAGFEAMVALAGRLAAGDGTAGQGYSLSPAPGAGQSGTAWQDRRHE